MRRLVVMITLFFVVTQAATAAPPRLGQLKHLPEPDSWKMGIFEPRGQDMLSTTSYYGLPHFDTWLDLFVRDDTGQWFVTAQHMVQDGTHVKTGGVLLNAGLMSQPFGLAMVPNPSYRSWLDGATQSLTADDQVDWNIRDPYADEDLAYGPRTLSWRSADGAIDLKGELVAPGSWYYLPTPQEAGSDKSDMYYANQYYTVSGTYSGRQVSGQVIIENLWGNVRYDNTWWVNHRSGNWTAWTTTYDDGTTEYGQFFCGPYGARGGVISDNKGHQVLQSNQINGYVDEKDAVDTPQKIRFEFGDGQQWQYTGDPTATILPQDGLGTSLSGGIVERIGEKRKVVSGHAVQLTAHAMCDPEELSPPAAPARMRLRVRPRVIRAGRSTRVRIVVRPAQAGVAIRVAGRRVLTDVRGRATITLHPRQAGRLRVRARRAGRQPASARVRVVR
jgi:hypothetical protein